MTDWRKRLTPLPARALPGGLIVHEALGARARRRGLARLSWLPDDRALHLRGCRAVHTFGMRFALDLVWLDKTGRPLRVDRDVAPRGRRTCLRAKSVVELRAGCADRFLRAALLGGGYTASR